MSFTKTRKLIRYFDYAALLLLAGAFLIGMNYITRNMGGSGVQLPFNIFFWLFAGCFMFFTTVRLSLVRRVYLPKTLLFYLGCVALLLLPLFYTNRLFLDVETLRLCGVAAAAFYLFCLYQNPSRFFKKNLLYILFLSTLIQTAWGLIQYYFVFESSRLFYLAEMGTPYGIFQQVNVFSSFIAVGSLFAVYFFSRAAEHQRVWFILALLLIAANAHLIALSQADSARIGGLVSLLIYASVAGWRQRRLGKYSTFFILATIVTFLPREWFDVRPVAEANVAQQSSSLDGVSEVMANAQPIIGQSTTQASSTSENDMLGTRPTIYAVALQMIADKPLTGHGIGSFTKQFLLYQGEYLKNNPDAPAEFALGHAHNLVLQWTIELGLVATLAFILIFVGWVAFILKGKVDPLILLIALPIVFQSMVEIPFSSSAPHLCMFITIVFLASKGGRNFKFPKLLGLVIVPASLWGTVMATLFLLSTMHALTMFLEFNKSGREKVEYLLKVKNPAAYKLRFEFELFQWKLRKARKEKRISREELTQYIYWAFSTTQYAPMQATYESFIESLILIGNKKAALDYAKEGTLMYPVNRKILQFRQEVEDNVSTNSE